MQPLFTPQKVALAALCFRVTFSTFIWLIEMAATGLGLLSVYLLTVGNGRGWSLGAVMIILMGVVYYYGGLYGSAVLQIFFLLTQFIGWRRWRLGLEKDLRKSSRRLKGLHWLLLGLSTALLYQGGVFLLEQAGGESVRLDSFVTSGSVVAQSLMVFGFGECWLWWLTVDIVYVGLMWEQNLYAFFLLYLVYCVLAINGWLEWTREVKS